MTKIQPVILCGGSGARLWPLSRKGFPKQFLVFVGNESLFQQSLQRAASIQSESFQCQAPCIVTNEKYRFLVLEQAREIDLALGSVILEPSSKNTAPALTLAALSVLTTENDPVLIVMPSDHIIKDQDVLLSSLQEAVQEAENGSIVTLGVRPDRPETGYGYIQIEHSSLETEVKLILQNKKVLQFVEKPDSKTAQQYIDEGNYYWNTGIFVMKASVWLEALHQFKPEILEAVRKSWLNHSQDKPFIRLNKNTFEEVPSESIDYAVMEKCPASEMQIQMIPMHLYWNDLGSWDAAWDLLPKNEQGNAYRGDVFTKDSQNNIVHANNRLVSLIGVSDLLVVETSDAVLVADRTKTQNIKDMVHALPQYKQEEHALHQKIYRPWGWYENIDEGEHFKVKRIQVNPDASLSLQKHYHRAEHWIVVKGTAKVTCGDQILRLTENQSTYIPLGEIHRLTNCGTIPLLIIEVQLGSYLHEDDIVRFKDHYGRSDE